eukprot:2230323-Amphidinium_carterae.4
MASSARGTQDRSHSQQSRRVPIPGVLPPMPQDEEEEPRQMPKEESRANEERSNLSGYGAVVEEKGQVNEKESENLNRRFKNSWRDKEGTKFRLNPQEQRVRDKRSRKEKNSLLRNQRAKAEGKAMRQIPQRLHSRRKKSADQRFQEQKEEDCVWQKDTDGSQTRATKGRSSQRSCRREGSDSLE